MEAAFRGKGSEEGGPIEGDIDGGKDEVEAAGGSFDFLGVTGVDGLVGSELQGFLAFGIAGGEGGDLASSGIQKGERHVAKAADAHDGDFSSGRDVELDERIENGDAAAEQGAGADEVEAIG